MVAGFGSGLEATGDAKGVAAVTVGCAKDDALQRRSSSTRQQCRSNSRPPGTRSLKFTDILSIAEKYSSAITHAHLSAILFNNSPRLGRVTIIVLGDNFCTGLEVRQRLDSAAGIMMACHVGLGSQLMLRVLLAQVIGSQQEVLSCCHRMAPRPSGEASQLTAVGTVNAGRKYAKECREEAIACLAEC